MADNRVGRARKNVVVALCCQLVTLICGLIVPRLMIGAFGSEVYGATVSISQFLSYIALLEGGIGGVARAVLYKPLAENDLDAVSAIMVEIKRFFQVVACIFVVYVIVLACSFGTISGTDCLDEATLFWLVIVISASTLAQYYIGISNAILLQAAQRVYVTNFVNIAGTVANAVMIVILVWLKCDIITVKLVSSVIFILKPLAMWLYVRRYYRLTGIKKEKKTYLTQKWSGLGQHIAYFLHSNTAVVVLTIIADLKAVAVYSVYNMVTANIQNLASSFVAGMEAVFGDMLARKEKRQLHKTFSTYETIISIIAVILFSVTAVMISSFVAIYTKGVNDVSYDEPLFALILILSALIYCIRMPYHALVIAAGHFKQTQMAAYGEAALNVLLSLLLVNWFGLVGVAAGTLIATTFRLIYYVLYLTHEEFGRHPGLFVKRFVVNVAAFTLSFVVGRAVIAWAQIDGYVQWAAYSVIVVLVSTVVTLVLNAVTYREVRSGLLKRRNC